MVTYNRFRTKTPRVPKTFYGDRKGKQIVGGTKLGTLIEYQANGAVLQSQELTASGTCKPSHAIERMWDEVHPGPPFKDGGPMAKVKILLPSSGTVGHGTYTSRGNPQFLGKARLEYTGGFAFSSYNPDGIQYDDYITVGSGLGFNLDHMPNLGPYETKAWDMLRPKIEKASASQFFYELRDLPGMLKTSAAGFKDLWHNVGGREERFFMHPRKAADHFLNHHFGWVPFINDLIKFYDVYENAEKYIDAAKRNNNRWIRRKRLVSQTFENLQTYKDYVALTMPGIGDPRIFRLQIDPQGNAFSAFSEATTRFSRRVWAEGKFTMYRPEFDAQLLAKFPSDWSRTKQMLLLYGVRINPSVLYKITPWSWLVDWFTGLGRNIEIWTNSIADSVAAKYAYLMCQDTRQVTLTTVLYFWSGNVTLSRVYSLDAKVRHEMQSPYGFNLPWDGLSAKQYGILGALGINRLPRRR